MLLSRFCPPALAAEAPATGTVNNPSASEKNVSAAKPVPMVGVPVWRQRQIAAARPITSKNTSFRPGEVLGTEVRSPQDEALGRIAGLVPSSQTDEFADPVIGLIGSAGIDEVNVRSPGEDFKISPNANLLVLNTTKATLDAAPRVNLFTTSGLDLQRQKVDA